MTSRPPTLADLAPRLAETALANVTREFPNAVAHVLQGSDDVARPRLLHPSFYGAYDWHSAVHMHWLLVTLLREHPDRIDAPRVRTLLRTHLAPDPLGVEAAYLRAYPGFERPYGWAWLLALAAACAEPHLDVEISAWGRALRPAADVVAGLLLTWLASASGPVRDGAHGNTAFALGLALDAARVLDLPDLTNAVTATATRWFVADRAAPAGWEPSGEDFLSPSLSEADLVRRLLGGSELSVWLDGFLPGLGDGQPRSLLEPVAPPERTDGRAGHLDGLNLSRAAAMRSIARALPAADPRHGILLSSAGLHVTAGLRALRVDAYASNHWLGTFAAMALGA